MATKARQHQQAVERQERIAVAAQLWRQQEARRPTPSFLDGLEAAARWHDAQAAKADGILLKADSRTEAGRMKLQNLAAVASQHRMYAAQIRVLKRDAHGERLRALGFRADG